MYYRDAMDGQSQFDKTAFDYLARRVETHQRILRGDGEERTPGLLGRVEHIEISTKKLAEALDHLSDELHRTRYLLIILIAVVLLGIIVLAIPILNGPRP